MSKEQIHELPSKKERQCYFKAKSKTSKKFEPECFLIDAKWIENWLLFILRQYSVMNF